MFNKIIKKIKSNRKTVKISLGKESPINYAPNFKKIGSAILKVRKKYHTNRVSLLCLLII